MNKSDVTVTPVYDIHLMNQLRVPKTPLTNHKVH